jgi:U32 family peptidase
MVSSIATNDAKSGRDAANAPGLPELLAPAGDWECAKAAVENGADAIYFGLDKFNARMRAHNFTEADLPKLMEFLHRRGVKGYVTFNTLVFQNELADAENHLRAIIAAGVDAAIVQDVGICRLIRQLSPDFPVHSSTQMTITSAAGVDFARELSCNLVVLARECSIAEIEKIQAAQSSAFKVQGSEPENPEYATQNRELPLEVFVHGALCVAYSGQCLTSESLGGRSANRGECAQACRMPYDLISDGKQVPLGDKRYLLSPQDLAGLEVLPELVRAGVASLKIEGRLKAPEYVASITKIYRQALDKISRSGVRENAAEVAESLRPSAESRYDMEMSFSRGLYTGWFGGVNNQQLVHARFGKKRGVFLGEVAHVQGEKVTLQLQAPLKLGDGVVFDAGRPDEKEEGGRIYAIKNFPNKITRTEESVLEFGYGNIDFNRVHVGDKLWKTNDPELDKRLRQSFAGDAPRFQRPLAMEVHGFAGKPLTVIARDEEGHVVRLDSALPLVKAEKQPLTTERLREQLGRLGGTPFMLGEFKNNLSGEVMLPMSELNRLRREVATELEKLRAQPKRWQLNDCSTCLRPVVSGVSPGTGGRQGLLESPLAPNDAALPQKIRRDAEFNPRDAGATQLILLVRSLPQLEAALKCGVQTVYCEFEDPKKYREAVTTFHTAYGCSVSQPSTLNSQPSIWVAPPRIFKMGEDWVLKLVRSCNADGYLVRNYDHLKFFADCRKRGDYSLNVANALAADYFKNKFGLEQIAPSYDLNFTQLEALLQAAPPEWFEVTIHQHMPMFHMEHCVFCAFLSSGTDYTNCGRPCDTHVVKLRDRVGAEHTLKADAGCRNTVFNSQTQSGAEYIAKMIELGVRNFRVEFLDETPEAVERTIAKYRQLLRGEIDGTQLWRELKLMSQLGVTRGQIAK